MSEPDGRHRVVIVGGGFGGLQAVRSLRRAPVEVTLVDRRNFHLFQPMLYQVATGALSPDEIATPLRVILKRQKNVRVVMGEVRDFDLDRRRLVWNDGRMTPAVRPALRVPPREPGALQDEFGPPEIGLDLGSP